MTIPRLRLLILFFLPLSPVSATDETYDVNKVEPGALYFATEIPGRVVRAPMQSTSADITITGPLVHSRIVQEFTNVSDAWVEGLYTYPLPKGAAVNHLEMQIGDRVIKGEIEEKAQALRNFDAAQKNGQRASLIIQRRPNIFTTKLANIGPGETIKIAIEYQDLIEPRDNLFELRFPMVVRPRYNPGIPLDDRASRAGWGFDTDQVPDGAGITQPLVLNANGPHNAVSLAIHLAAGFDIADLTSPSHDLDIHQTSGKAEITLKDDSVNADQDFILRWRPSPSEQPQMGLFKEETADGYHFLLMLMPPAGTEAPESAAARDLVIVLDKSGSMSGQAIRQAKAAVRRALMRLNARDSFNLIAFDNMSSALFPESRPATERNIDTALDFLNDIEAGGGTEMSSALSIALGQPALDEETTVSPLRQVIFVTDGAVGNETALMAQIKQDLGKARLFPIGIGSAPNNFFMSEAAHFGRGAYINIAMNDDVLDAMAGLFSRIERPQLTGISLDGLGQDDDIVPGLIPDLYDGEPVVIALRRTSALGQPITLNGMRGGKPWSKTVPASFGSKGTGIAELWARRKIQAVNRAFVGRGSADDQLARRENILKLALGYHLVSDFTSLIAIEQKIARPPEEISFRREVAANLPAGMDWGQPKRFSLIRGAIQARAHDARQVADQVAPRSTATPMQLYLILGGMLLLLALILRVYAAHMAKARP